VNRLLTNNLSDKKRIFAKIVMRWGKEHSFDYPWRNTADPFHILVAEVMLQRTKADQVIAVYNRFVNKFPDAYSLSEASHNNIRSVIKPLGLDYRVARLKRIASTIANEYSGVVPSRPEDLVSVQGIGNYVASAVRCFAFNEKTAILDANIARMIGRVFSIKIPPDPHKQKYLWDFIEPIVPDDDPKIFNWAIIDIGRTICIPRKPKCVECPLKDICDFAQKSLQK